MGAIWDSLRKNRHFHFRIALLVLFLIVLGNHPTAYTAKDGAGDSTVSSLPPSALRLEDAVNAVREGMNLPALTLDPRLCAAADGHAAYLMRNHVFSHEERASLRPLLWTKGGPRPQEGSNRSRGPEQHQRGAEEPRLPVPRRPR